MLNESFFFYFSFVCPPPVTHEFAVVFLCSKSSPGHILLTQLHYTRQGARIGKPNDSDENFFGAINVLWVKVPESRGSFRHQFPAETVLLFE